MDLRLYRSTRKHQWAFHWIPSIQLYSESQTPFTRFMGKFGGLYLSFQFLKWEFIFGVYKNQIHNDSGRKSKKSM
jgi:hypothetical protein